MCTTHAHAATESCMLRRRNAVNDEHESRNGPVEMRHYILLPLSVFALPVKKQAVAPFSKTDRERSQCKCNLFLWMSHYISRSKINHECLPHYINLLVNRLEMIVLSELKYHILTFRARTSQIKHFPCTFWKATYFLSYYSRKKSLLYY